MCSQIGDRAGTLPALEPPIEGDIRVEKLVREPQSAPQPGLADAALVDQLLHQGKSREVPVVEADRGRHDRPSDRVGGPQCTGVVGGQRLLAQHGLAGRSGGFDDLRMGARRRAHVDDVHVAGLDHLAPVRHGALDPVQRGRALDRGTITPADQTEPWPHGQLADVWGERVAVAVGLAHQSVADDPDADLGRGGPAAGAHRGTATRARTCEPPASAAAASSAALSAAKASAPSAPSRSPPRSARAKASA